MADFTSSYNPQPIDPGQTMSRILGIQQQRQDLQTGQYRQQSAQADAQGAQRVQAEQQSVANYISNPANKGKSADEMQDDLMSIAPTTGADALAKIRTNENTKIQVQTAASKLSQDNKDQAGNLIRSLSGGQQTPEQVSSMLDAAEAINPQLKSVLDPLRDRIQHMPPPGAVRDQGVAQVATMLDGKSGVSAGSINTGTQTQITKTDAQGNVAPTGQSFDNTQIGQTGTGQAAIIGPKGVQVLPSTGTPTSPSGASPIAAPGASPSAIQPPRTAQQDAPGANDPRAVQENYQKASSAAQQHVEDTRKADAEYGNNVSISNAIRHLAPGANTGPGKEALNNTLAGLGFKSGSDTQELGAFLDRQAAGLRTQMGLPGTNAGAEESKSIAGNTHYTMKTIMDKNDYTQSLIEGAHQYRHGIDRVAGFSGQASPKAVSEFRSAWADNFDPNVYKADLMKKQGKLAEFVDSLDPKEAASLAQKRKNLQMLSNGQIPPK